MNHQQQLGGKKMRLNSGYRAEIVRATVTAAFEKEEKRLAAQESKLARRCWETIVPTKVRKLVSDLPKGWLSEKNSFRFNVTGLTVTLKSDVAFAVPHSLGYLECFGSIVAGTLADEVLALVNAKEELKKTREKANSTLTALLNQHSTTDTLVEAWPEGARFVKGLARKVPVPSLPAVRIEELNAMLGLKQAA